ncbi:formyl transferase [Aequorivita sp. 609]|uniref:formyl transferase n=1 Tax=Aequorivita TaxID=153265 RepID=UPI001609A25E|nr:MULTISPECIES: formyl transferase [Aequorivita]MBB6681529.1 formyl transferase [Aequorivita sp. 609]
MKVIMLAGSGPSTKYIYNGLSKEFKINKVIITGTPSKKKLVKRRIKNLGYFRVINQLLFQVIVVKVLKIFTISKFERRKAELKLEITPIPDEVVIKVGAVNSKKTIRTIKMLNPDVIIVNGTTIISSKVLNSSNAIFINTHVGITPEYRGVHGGYWALRNNDKENFGVTVHIVDKGIDTGSIIYQKTTEVKRDDNFLTYPLYQYAIAIPMLQQTLSDIEGNQLKTYKKENSLSRLYYHPTFTKYISGFLFKGVK